MISLGIGIYTGQERLDSLAGWL